ncbi:hypothetical protein ECG_07737 [Echinococcus granulosus]|uniref:Protein quiver n=1 Tax=Echinococcus granulosus TaxID=6210 RepID=W6UFW3_ECHGR|nr:hypothetical protein EGR_08209 [Echinococcus granulosus]EUB56972.1 hypothetical protein EGR_08209 [Echinococcus granulosus]KAH9279540.1 hypothetical protein ECG_07737 [Echinococcus granulosus]
MSRGHVVPSLLLLLVVLTAFLGVNGLKCYQCESHKEEGCFPLDAKLVKPTECPPDAQVCTILKQEAQFKLAYGEDREPKVRYLRGCSSEAPKGAYYCVERAGTGSNTKNRYCTCDSDACNPADRNAVLSGALAAVMLLLISNLA